MISVMTDGKIKTTGASHGAHTVVFDRNEFQNVRISDYHQNWVSTYSNNTWTVSAQSSQDYLWGERAAIGAQPWQSPTYGAMHITGNQVLNEKDKLIVLYTKRWDAQKLMLTRNTFQGKSFIWLKSDGERRDLLSTIPYPMQVFSNDWTIDGEKALQSSKRIVDWEDFKHLVPDNEWIR